MAETRKDAPGAAGIAGGVGAQQSKAPDNFNPDRCWIAQGGDGYWYIHGGDVDDDTRPVEGLIVGTGGYARFKTEGGARQYLKFRKAIKGEEATQSNAPATTATPERRSSSGHSEIKPDGNERRSGDVDREGGGSNAVARGDALGAGSAECGSRAPGREGDREGSVTGEGASTPSSIVSPAVEAVEQNAKYWLRAGRDEPDRDQAVIMVEQAMNAYKNAFYAMVRAGKDHTAAPAMAAPGWSIRHVDGRWRTMDTIGMPDWTDDADKALSFRLREHADTFAQDDPDDVRIVPSESSSRG